MLFIDFEGTAGERFWRKLLYGEAYGLRGVREAPKIEGLRIPIGSLGKKEGGFRSILLRVHRPLQKLLHEVFPRDEFESGFYGDPLLPIAFSLHSVLQAGAGVRQMARDAERIRPRRSPEFLDHANPNREFMRGRGGKPLRRTPKASDRVVVIGHVEALLE
ncbi:MAG: hypothetical protein ACR65T_06280 [Methylocystis sp.]|uniref:hypothetical protein n=1 Tax=Methylocystis sp. TaxID=1911079 RepID=UPI003DA2D69B